MNKFAPPKLVRITLFVENLDTQTEFYRDALKLPIVDIRTGWSEFGSGKVTIALHKGKGRKPRLEFLSVGPIDASLEYLNSQGAKLGPLKEIRGKIQATGKDKDGNTILLCDRASGKRA